MKKALVLMLLSLVTYGYTQPIWVVKEEIDNLPLKHKKIVFAQFLLETGFGKSEAYLKLHNTHGWTNKQGLMRFPSWQASIHKYLYWQSMYYKGGDYYLFLQKIGYATDSNYIWRVKYIANQIHD